MCGAARDNGGGVDGGWRVLPFHWQESSAYCDDVKLSTLLCELCVRLWMRLRLGMPVVVVVDVDTDLQQENQGWREAFFKTGFLLKRGFDGP